MLIAEFTIDHPVLLHSLRTVSDIEAVWEATYEQPDGPPQMLFWFCGDVEAAVEALEADEAVRNPTLLTEVEGGHLYRVTFTDLGSETNLMPQLMAVGAALQSAVGTSDGWACRARFPDRAALDRVYRFCCEHDISFTLDSLYDRAALDGTDAADALTEKQHEVLRRAYEDGYFAVPKETSLDAIGANLGVSKQAVSGRLNRGLNNVLGSTLFADG